MALSLGRLTRTAVNIFKSSATQEVQAPVEVYISPLDARLPDVSLNEIKNTGKSAERIRTERGVGSPVDWLTVKIEDAVSRPGRERR